MIERSWACPYCWEEVEIEPPGSCCDETQGQWLYIDSDGKERTEAEWQEQEVLIKSHVNSEPPK